MYGYWYTSLDTKCFHHSMFMHCAVYKTRLGHKRDPITWLWCHLYDNNQIHLFMVAQKMNVLRNHPNASSSWAFPTCIPVTIMIQPKIQFLSSLLWLFNEKIIQWGWLEDSLWALRKKGNDIFPFSCTSSRSMYGWLFLLPSPLSLSLVSFWVLYSFSSTLHSQADLASDLYVEFVVGISKGVKQLCTMQFNWQPC